MQTRHTAVATVALAMALAPIDASALIVARVTRHGYIMVDEDEAVTPYDGRVPVTSVQDTLQFAAEVTQVLDALPDAPRADYIGVMQTSATTESLAFYMGIKNDTLGIGMRSPLGGTRETFDINPVIGTAYPLTGFVFLNSIQYYVNPGLVNFGRYLICTQEFGHRYGTFVRNPPIPGGPVDGGTADDASVPDSGGPPLAADGLLGRQRAHWSYFVNSGGSPMEGNDWLEVAPGQFRTRQPRFQFSPLDLYIMGLLPASSVPPFWIIADPVVGSLRDQNGRPLTRESPPEYQGRTITLNGRRVTYTIDDVIRANGPRIPAYNADAGSGDGGGAHPDLNVIWVLLARPDEVTPRLGILLDQAVELCTSGYDGATGGRSHLIPFVAPQPPDAGTPDAGIEEDVPVIPDDTGDTDGSMRDGSAADAGPMVRNGCGCEVPAKSATDSGSRYRMAIAIAALAFSARRRRKPSRFDWPAR